MPLKIEKWSYLQDFGKGFEKLEIHFKINVLMINDGKKMEMWTFKSHLKNRLP